MTDTTTEPEDHKIVEAMGMTWDEGGFRPPRNWHYVCSCGFVERSLKGQIETYRAWEAHRDTGGRADR